MMAQEGTTHSLNLDDAPVKNTDVSEHRALAGYRERHAMNPGTASLALSRMTERKANRLRLWVAQPSPADPLSSGSARVGDVLRQQREARGLGLDDVAAAIRIPPRHLESIEAGRYHALPARTYALGFVRSYADFLGLEPRRVVDRFKTEARELDARPVLIFPEPAAERRVPGGALVAVGVCAALTVYAAWYMQTARHWARNDLVPPAPIEIAADPAPADERRVVDLAPTLGGSSDFVPPTDSGSDAAGSATVPSWRTVAAAPPALEMGTAGVPTAGPVGMGPSGQLASNYPASGQPVSGALAPATQLAELPVADGPPRPRPRPDPSAPAASAGPAPHTPAAPAWGPYDPSAPAGATRVAALPPPVSYLTTPSAPPPAVTVEALPGSRVDPSSWAPVGSPAAQPAEMTGSGPGAAWAQVPRTASGPVLLKAVEASWIEVRGESGEVVHARLMKAGETYEVPARPGLRLTTGNAGGLDVTVGGETAPRLGARGAVMREIPLEGQRLLSGITARN